MTFDERLDRLKERHDALIRSLQLLLLRQEADRRFRANGKREINSTLSLFEQLAVRLSQTGAFLNTLAQDSQRHEHRLDALDGGSPEPR